MQLSRLGVWISCVTEALVFCIFSLVFSRGMTIIEAHISDRYQKVQHSSAYLSLQTLSLI